METSRRYLVHFFKKWKYLDFCLPELESLAEMHGADISTLYDETTNARASIDMKKSTLVYVNLPSDEVARQIQSRSIMIKEIIDVFSESKGSYDELVKNVDVALLQSQISTTNKFKFLLEGIGIKITSSQQIDIIEQFKVFPFDQSLVDMVKYDDYYKIIHNKEDDMIYFGKKVASIIHNPKCDELFYSPYNLKLRPYLGPTSTDHELAFLMAN